MPRTQRAFTLIELLVVIAIINLLASMVLASLNNARKNAKGAQVLESVRSIQIALDQYAQDHNGNYPHDVSTGNPEVCLMDQSNPPQFFPCSSTLSELTQSGGYLSALPHFTSSDFSSGFLMGYMTTPNNGNSETYYCGRKQFRYMLFFTDPTGIRNFAWAEANSGGGFTDLMNGNPHTAYGGTYCISDVFQ